jgi:hypothetical protein
MQQLITCILIVITTFAHNDDAAYTHHTLARNENSEIVYYLSSPAEVTDAGSPLVLLCDGSYCDDKPIRTVLHLHKLFVPLLKDCNVHILSLEKWGVDGKHVDQQQFHAHNTISQRVNDHATIINHLMQVGIDNWNGQLIFIGGSEGCDVITALTLAFAQKTIAAAFLTGIGLHTRQDEIWTWLSQQKNDSSWLMRLYLWWQGATKQRADFDLHVNYMIEHPDPAQWYLGQTYAYWADVFTRTQETLLPEFYNLRIPMFIAIGTADESINSTDELVARMQEHQMLVTYRRIDGIRHGIGTHYPAIFDEAAAWLHELLG